MRLDFVWLASFVLCVCSPGAHALTWCVAPTGNDSGPGTEERPFLTIQRALDDSRRSTAPADTKRIELKSGFYFDTSLVLGPEDSGLTIAAAPGAKPVLVGGREIGGLRTEGKFWVVDLPPQAPVDLRLLVVNDHLAPRARFPESGTLQHLSRFPVPWMGTYGGGWQRKPTVEELTTLRVDAATLGPAFEPQNAELTIYHEWDESLVGVANYEASLGLIRFTGPTGHPPGAFGKQTFVIWNTRDGMTRPGQWYLDRVQRKLFYWPPAGEACEQSHVLIPTTETIIRISGRGDAPVKDMLLEGLTCTVNNTPLKAGGFGAYAFEGALSATHVKGLRLARLKFFNLAGQGIKFSQAADSEVRDCEITSVGAGGILADGSRLLIAGNQVTQVGRIYPSGIGITCNGTNNKVVGNLIQHTPYVGITCDGLGAHIEHNRLEEVMEELHDGAGIYLGGTGHVIRANFCLRIGTSVADRRHAYYMDEHVRDSLLEANLALECPSPLHNHMATNNVIANNVFVNHGDVRLAFYRCGEHQLRKNVVWAAGKVEVYRPEAVASWGNTFVFSGAKEVLGYPVDGYSPGRPSPLQRADLTILTNLPLVIDPVGKVTLPDDSAPSRAGIAELDVRDAGVLRRGLRPDSIP